jgi:hypothetical protein
MSVSVNIHVCPKSMETIRSGRSPITAFPQSGTESGHLEETTVAQQLMMHNEGYGGVSSSVKCLVRNLREPFTQPRLVQVSII